MGHDHHFLSRLDRVASSEVELALSLYRDHALVREVLSYAKLPEGAGRVAISLAHPEEGPFVVVARDGGFVTCLGRGMHPRSLPIITRTKLDAISSRVEKLREGLQMAVALTGGRFNRLFLRLYTAGPMLTREEMIALSAIQPLISGKILLLLLDCSTEVQKVRVALRKVSKPRGRHEKFLRRSWGFLWAVGHYAVLAGMGGRKTIERMDPEHRWFADQFLDHVFKHGVFSLSLKGIWTASKLGKVLLPAMKQRHANIRSFFDYLTGMSALHAISYGHSRLRAEAKKALLLPPVPETEPLADVLNLLRRRTRETVEEAERHAHEADEFAVAWGRAVAVQWLNRAPRDSPHRYEREEDVPDDIARAFTAWHFGHSGRQDVEMEVLYRMTPWIVKRRAEDLFLPASLLNAVRVPDVPVRAHDILQRPFRASWMSMPKPVRAARTPGRNEPCVCGSGKKHKRCCGAR